MDAFALMATERRLDIRERVSTYLPMLRALRLLTLLALMVGTTGCAAGLSLAGAPSVDTTGHFGTEERAQVFAGVGSQKSRIYGALAGGGGYLGRVASGYGMIAVEGGFEGGQAIVWSAGGFFAPRFFFTGPAGVAPGGGTAGQVLFRVARTGGEDGSFLIGPRLSAEVVQVDPSAPESQRTAGLFQLGLVLRATMFDTSAKSWSY